MIMQLVLVESKLDFQTFTSVEAGHILVLPFPSPFPSNGNLHPPTISHANNHLFTLSHGNIHLSTKCHGNLSQKLFTTSDIYLNFSTFHISDCPMSDIGQNTSDISDVFGVFGLHCHGNIHLSSMATSICPPNAMATSICPPWQHPSVHSMPWQHPSVLHGNIHLATSIDLSTPSQSNLELYSICLLPSIATSICPTHPLETSICPPRQPLCPPRPMKTTTHAPIPWPPLNPMNLPNYRDQIIKARP